MSMKGGFLSGTKKFAGLFRRSRKEDRYEQAPEPRKRTGRRHQTVQGSERSQRQAHRHARELAGRADNKRRMQIKKGKRHVVKLKRGRTNAMLKHSRKRRTFA